MNQPANPSITRIQHALRAFPMCVLLLSALPGNDVFALDPARDLLQYNCRAWSRQNGLPVNGINAITQTKDGYLWLGTSVGLVRFDGIEFKLFDLAHVPQLRNSIVVSLAPAQEHGLWVGLENSSFGFFDGCDFTFYGKNEWGKLDLNIRALWEGKDGTLWLAAQSLAASLSPSGNYQEVLGTSAEITLNILCGCEDSRGRCWFGTASQGLYYWQDGKTNKFPDPTLDNVLIAQVVVDPNGDIWLGTGRGLRRYDSEFKPKEVPALPVEIRVLLMDREGVLWIGTVGQGLVRYSHGTFSHLRKADGLASDYVNALAEDREGSLWVATANGLSQLTDVKFPTQPAAEDLSVKNGWAVGASKRGGIWIGSAAGVTYFDGKPKTFSTEAGLPKNFVKRVFEAGNGDVYLVSGTRDLVIMSGGKVVAKYAAPNMVVGMTEDTHGVVVSVGGSLYRAGTNYFTPYTFTNGEPDLKWVLNLAPSRDGSIWVATGNGIFRVKDDAYQHWPSAPGLDRLIVQWICEDDEGVVWGALLTGIVRLKNNQVRYLSRRDGLFNDNIYAIIPDDYGNLWVDSGRGIFRASRKNLNDVADGKADRVHCVAYDGPESVKTPDKTRNLEHVGCKTADGRIWFPNPLGVVMVDPARVPTNQIAPPVHIDRVLVNGRELAPRATGSVPSGKGELEIHFTALSFIAPQKTRFRYQLTGYDKEWVDAGDRRLAFYANLKPGRYSFRVIAANADGIWNEAGDSMEVKLLPHFYQTGWFYLLCGGASLASLIGLYTWRVRHLARRHHALQEARDCLEAEVQSRTVELARANTSLQQEVEGRKRTAVELAQRTRSLENEIEERKRVGRALQQSSEELQLRNDELARFNYTVSHDLKSPLVTIKAFLGYLERDTGKQDTEAIKKDLGYIYTAVDKMTRLLDELLHLARVGHKMNPPEEVPLQVVVKDALDMVAGRIVQRGVKVVVTKEPIRLCGDRTRLVEVFQNLVDNAIKFMGDQPTPCVEIGVETAGDEQVFFVRDNGMGIDPQFQPKVFGLFEKFDPKAKGTGIGLALIKRIVEAHDGKIWVESAGMGKGTTFRFTLAKTQPPPAQSKSNEQS